MISFAYACPTCALPMTVTLDPGAPLATGDQCPRCRQVLGQDFANACMDHLNQWFSIYAPWKPS